MYSLCPKITVVCTSQEKTLTKYILKNITVNMIFESSFLTNLFGDTNIERIFYISSWHENWKQQLIWDGGSTQHGKQNKRIF